MENDEHHRCYLNFFLNGIDISKKYNLKFQKRFYEDLIDSYCYKHKINIKENLRSSWNYINYDNLNDLYIYSRRECENENCDNIIKYAYIYCCYKLNKEKREKIILMLLDEEFLKYNIKYDDNKNNNNNKKKKKKKKKIYLMNNKKNDNNSDNNYNVDDTYIMKNIKVYEERFYNVQCIPGYSVGYYLMGKIYEKEGRKEWFSEIRKKKLIDISFMCYYLGYKSCPYLICCLKKMIKLHSNFYFSVMYQEIVGKLSKMYNANIHVYKKLKCKSLIEKENDDYNDDYNDDDYDDYYDDGDDNNDYGDDRENGNNDDYYDGEYKEKMDDHKHNNKKKLEEKYKDDDLNLKQMEDLLSNDENSDDFDEENKNDIVNEDGMIEKIRNMNFDENLLELIEMNNSINIKDVSFISSLLEKEEIEKLFLNCMSNLNENIIPNIDNNKNKWLSDEGIHDLIIIVKVCFFFYLNKFEDCLLLIEEWKNKPIFSIYILYIKGLCYFYLGDYEKSAYLLEKIFDIECLYSKHLPYLSTCYWYKKDIEKIEYILLTYEKKEINEYYLCLIGNYFSLKNNKRLGTFFFKKAMKSNIFYEYSYILYSSELKHIGNINKATLVLLKCILINPSNFRAHLLLSVIFFNEGNINIANVHLSLCLKLYMTNPIICLYCACLYNYKEKYETALLCLEQAQKHNYKGPELFILKGMIFLKMKRNVDALNSFLKVQNLYPNCIYINTFISLTLTLEKKFDKAKKIVKEIFFENPYIKSTNTLLKDIYKCCNSKTLPSKCILNKIDFVLKQECFNIFM
ncbi:anaphase promoting complex subunit, putative [Plasmodium gaboni]|uniref:Anaphase promoting complex subunit, putative n=1 Tax=Plasmodium gaboni TaxID=647221 RepID=A0ABY1UJP2_9APIC|nr:anaphase promoting complex subunit, putative [Plasmodium gaboni]